MGIFDSFLCSEMACIVMGGNSLFFKKWLVCCSAVGLMNASCVGCQLGYLGEVSWVAAIKVGVVDVCG